MSRCPPTRWSLVVRASRDNAEGRNALGELVRVYAPALYALARRQGLPPEDAQEAVQDFSLRLWESTTLRDADQQRGRFRSYLFGAFRNDLLDAHRRERAAKRGGSYQRVDFDIETVERTLRGAPSSDEGLEACFDAVWARALLDQVAHELGAEYEARGSAELWNALARRLTVVDDSVDASLLDRLQMRRSGFSVALHRARKRFGLRLRAAVRDTLIDPRDADVDAELRHLVRLATKTPNTL